MNHLCITRYVKHRSIEKVRLYSSCLTSNNFYATNKHNISFCEQKRQFSFQPTVESLVKTQTGLFKSLSESTAVSYVQDFVLKVHDISGLPWWASIILTTIILRSLITVPLAIYQHYIFAKVENLAKEMPAIIQQLKKETAFAIQKFKWDERTARITFNRSVKKQWQKLIIRENCHPFKASILLWAQIPLWICLSVSFRNLVFMLPKSDVSAQITFMELTAGGVGWIPNLVMQDTTFIIPVTIGIVNLLITEIMVYTRKGKPKKLQKYAINFLRGFNILIIPVTASFPSCLTLYWLSSSVYGLVQNLILLSPKVRRLTGVPKTDSELKNPYLHIATKVKDRCSFKKTIDTN